jgi:hypothetical protein
MGGIGEQLHVVARNRAPFTVSHYVGVRVGARRTRHELFAIVLLLLLQTLHFTDRRFQPTRPLPRRALPGRRLPLGGGLLLLAFCVENAQLLARQFQMGFEFLSTAEGIVPGIGFDFRRPALPVPV